MTAAGFCMDPFLGTRMMNCSALALSLKCLIDSGCQAVTHGRQVHVGYGFHINGGSKILLSYASAWKARSWVPMLGDSTHQRALQWLASFPSWSQLLRTSLVCWQQHCLQQASEP